MNRRQWRIYVTAILVILSFTAVMSSTGIYFITNQYVLYRYSDDAGLPYPPASTAESCGSSNKTVDPDRDKHSEVQAKAARLLSASSLVVLLAGMFSSFFVGRLSDRRGRRLAMGIILFGQAIHHTVIVFVILLRWPIAVIFVGSIASGFLGGGLLAFILQVNVCLTDVTTTSIDTKSTLNSDEQSKRTRQERRRLVLLGLFDAVMMLGFSTTNVFIGTLIQNFGFVVAVLGMLGLFCIPVLLLWMLPETGPVFEQESATICNVDQDGEISVTVRGTRRSSFVSEITSRLNSLANGVSTIVCASNRMSVLVLLLIFLLNLVVNTDGSFFFLYVMAEPFCWSPEQVGFYSGLISFLMTILTVIFTGITALSMRTAPPVVSNSTNQEPETVINNVETDDRCMDDAPLLVNSAHQRQILRNRLLMIIYVLVSFITLTITRVMIGCAFLFPHPQCTAFVLFAMILSLVRSSVLPTLKSFLSSIHDSTKQGQVFSVIGICDYFSQLIGIPTLPTVYAFTVAVFPGAVFFLAAGLSAVAVIITCVLLHFIARQMRVLSSSYASIGNASLQPSTQDILEPLSQSI